MSLDWRRYPSGLREGLQNRLRMLRLGVRRSAALAPLPIVCAMGGKTCLAAQPRPQPNTPQPVLQTFFRRWGIWLAYALLLVVLPLVLGSNWGLSLLSQVGIAILICLSYNMLLGQGGMLSFGHAVYVGAGAFVAMYALRQASAGWYLPVGLLPLVGGLGSAALALVLGWLSTRKTATAFAMITFGLGELVWAISLMLPAVFGGEGGLSGNRVVGAPILGISYGPALQMYGLIAVYTWVGTALMYAFTRTPLGRLLNAVRDNPQRLEFLGYDAKKVRYLAFVAAAFFAGVAGGLSALQFEIVSTEVFSVSRSGTYLLFTVLGGVTLFWGPILGAVLMVLVLVWLSTYTQAWLLYLGFVFVGVVMYAPGGLAALLVQHVQAIKQGYWRRLWPSYVLLLASVGLALLGLSVLVEMLYHLQFNAALGPQLTLMRFVLHTQHISHWLAAALVLGLGVVLAVLCGRWLMRNWQAVQNSRVPIACQLQQPENDRALA